MIQRIRCFFGWHVPGAWRYREGEIPWTHCTACDELLYKGLFDEEYFQ